VKTVAEIIEKIGEYEKFGYSRDQAIEIMKIEQMVIIGNRLSNISNKLGNSSNRTP